MRELSDQQKLIDDLAMADGDDGYLVVVEVDDRAAPVQLSDVYSLLR